MKRFAMLMLVLLFVANCYTLVRIYRLNGEIAAQVSDFKSGLEAKLKGIEELNTAMNIVKGAVGWKSTKLAATMCMDPEAYYEGAFSFTTYENGNKFDCTTHEFTKLNDFVKAAGSYYQNGRFQDVLRIVTGGNLPPMEDMKAEMKGLLETLQK